MENKLEKIHLSTIVPATLAGTRLDVALTTLLPAYSRSRLQNWIRAGQVTVDGRVPRVRDKVYENQVIIIAAGIQPAGDWQPEAIPLTIVYEDADLLVINKPVGLVVHPGAGNATGTLVNALLYYLPQLIQLPRAGIIHRLDKDTSGLLIVAKTLPAYAALTKQLQRRLFKREYQAVVVGALIAGGRVEAPIGRDARQRTRQAVIATGKPAITHYRVIERFRAHTLLNVRLETGRTHQIRVHMAYIHHPLVGDKIYGGRLCLPGQANTELMAVLRTFKRQALHAGCLGVTHPQTQAYQEWRAPIPEDLHALLVALRADTEHYRQK